MKAILLLTACGPMAVLTSYEALDAPGLLNKLEAKGIVKFSAYEIPVELARRRFGGLFTAAQRDLQQTDDLRVLDYSGERIFSLFRFNELGNAMRFEGGKRAPDPTVGSLAKGVQ